MGFLQPLMLYTNADTIKQMRAWPSRLAEVAAAVTLHLAWYSEGDPPPSAYAPWEKVTIRQHAQSAVGALYGMESGSLDTDTWNGSLDELKAFVARAPAPPTVEERLTSLETWRKSVEK